MALSKRCGTSSQEQKHSRVSNHGQTYSVKGLTTKTMNDVSIDETQIVGGDYMGRSINRLGNYTTGNGKQGSGRDITNKQVGKISQYYEAHEVTRITLIRKHSTQSRLLRVE